MRTTCAPCWQRWRRGLDQSTEFARAGPGATWTAAILASLTSSCRGHEVDPQLYLTQLLVNLPALCVRNLPAWLPDQWKPNQAAHPNSLPK